MSFVRTQLTDILVNAKKLTYAGQGDEASVQPLLNGSKQLEYRSGDYYYRDIYMGMAFFVGQETVEFRQQPLWSMAYSGGVIGREAAGASVASIYSFLREALRLVDVHTIYRGPHHYEAGSYTYKNEYEGTLDCFYGHEIISQHGSKLYELQYSGGMIR